MATQGDDIGNTRTAALSNSSAKAVRHVAANALARSPHPQAKKLLFSMHEDPATSVRITVIQAAAQWETPESLALLKRHTQDEDHGVRNEAIRLLEKHEGGATR